MENRLVNIMIRVYLYLNIRTLGIITLDFIYLYFYLKAIWLLMRIIENWYRLLSCSLIPALIEFNCGLSLIGVHYQYNFLSIFTFLHCSSISSEGTYQANSPHITEKYSL
jgi:hypothetical protein